MFREDSPGHSTGMLCVCRVGPSREIPVRQVSLVRLGELGFGLWGLGFMGFRV